MSYEKKFYLLIDLITPVVLKIFVSKIDVVEQK